MNTPVSYELAKLLKAKEFEQDAFKHINKATMEGTLVFPSIAEVIMWLYEKYNIWISVTYQRHSEGKHWRYTINQIYRTEIVLWEHNTPTEAYEAAIKYCLEICI